MSEGEPKSKNLLETLAEQYSESNEDKGRIFNRLQNSEIDFDGGRKGQPQQGIRDLIRQMIHNTIAPGQKSKK